MQFTQLILYELPLSGPQVISFEQRLCAEPASNMAGKTGGAGGPCYNKNYCNPRAKLPF